jgi:5-formyltetrahydrofolate cyclo-ligase
MAGSIASPSPITSKSDIRKQVLARRDALGAAERQALSERITARLLGLEAYRAARCVMAYMSFGGEFETSRFIADIRSSGRRLVLPRVDGASRAIKIHEVRDLQRELATGVWGIREPRVDLCPEVPASGVGLVLVPGVAFTRRGERLGYGGGYYDGFIRGLGSPRPALVAAAFELQLVDELPVSERDQKVDCILTEDAEYQRRES